VKRRRVVEGCLSWSLGRDRRVWTGNVRMMVRGLVALRTQSYFVIESHNDQRWRKTLVSKYHAQYGRPRLSLATMATSETSNHLSLASSPFVRPSINLLQRYDLIVRLGRLIDFRLAPTSLAAAPLLVAHRRHKSWFVKRMVWSRQRETWERPYRPSSYYRRNHSTLLPVHPFLIWELLDYTFSDIIDKIVSSKVYVVRFCTKSSGQKCRIFI